MKQFTKLEEVSIISQSSGRLALELAQENYLVDLKAHSAQHLQIPADLCKGETIRCEMKSEGSLKKIISFDGREFNNKDNISISQFNPGQILSTQFKNYCVIENFVENIEDPELFLNQLLNIEDPIENIVLASDYDWAAQDFAACKDERGETKESFLTLQNIFKSYNYELKDKVSFPKVVKKSDREFSIKFIESTLWTKV